LLVLVAVPVPTLNLLTYAVPAGIEVPAVGARVVVPIGARFVTGVVVENESVTAGTVTGLKPIRRALDREAFLPAEIVSLALWTAEYYAAGAGETITALLPPAARGERANADKRIRFAALTEAGRQAIGRPNAGRSAAPSNASREPQDQGRRTDEGPRTKDEGPRAGKGRALEALQILAGSPAGMATPALAARGISSDTLARLVRRHLIAIRHQRVERDPFESAALPTSHDPERTLTDEQSAALRRLRAMLHDGMFKVGLLHGVTGSGKTEIYRRLAAEARSAGRSVLMLVPEISLTPAVAALFRQAFGDRVAIQHSALSDGERHDQWQRIRRGAVDVVIGTRSAVFAPLERLGLVIVDEEHDTSYKQEESPRYNGRDVAIVRAQRANALVVLGSATPSLESYQNAISGKYERIVLERRVLDRPLASVTIVDMREEFARHGPDVVLSKPLKDALGDRLSRGDQALILLNRRGFATAVFCRQCAGTMDCPNCSVSLVVHGAGASRRARCHYCNFSMRVPPRCPLCAGPYLDQAGFGTERVEAEVKRDYPNARVARLDRDSLRRKGSLADLLARFRGGALDILVGTQMIAKGHDFPRVTLVGVISADVGLGMSDFRASERTFQLLTQVSGRAGRGEQAGEAIIQTLYPGHYSIQLACRQDYPRFFERELHYRRTMRYPPLLSMVNTIVKSKTFEAAMNDAASLAKALKHEAASTGTFTILGPAPAALEKLRGEYRAQLLLKGTNRRAMREALQRVLAQRPDLSRRTTVDVDPLNVL
jgi:primosomal protein N' (replication factor Y)